MKITNLKKPFALIFCTLILSTISMPVSYSSRIFLPNDIKLIDETCKQTPNYNLCIHYLQNDPQSSDADVTGLALIMVIVIKSKAKDALDKIHQLLQGNPEPEQKEALSSCADRYKAILEADVPQAIAALQQGVPKFAEQGANDAAIEGTSCENSFSGESPLTNHNNAMHDVAEVTAAIVRLLL